MTSMAAASRKGLEGLRGIVFFGFPLHRPGSPSIERAEHLLYINLPMLFLQGTRDKLAELELLKPIIRKLDTKAVLHIIEGADHSFNLLKSSGKEDGEIFNELAMETSVWASKIG